MKQVLNDTEIADAFAGANFGSRDHRGLLEQGCLKLQAGYRCGHTLTQIMKELGLSSDKGLLKKGRRFMFDAFYDKMNTG